MAGPGREAIGAMGSGQVGIAFCQTKQSAKGGGESLTVCFVLAKQDPKTEPQNSPVGVLFLVRG